MLTKLTLENFKAFEKPGGLNIKPITILCGANSCGKSSILQSVLLMKQSLENKNPNQNLLLNGRFTNLGYFRDIVFKKEKERELKIRMEFKNGSGDVWGYPGFGYPNNYAAIDPYSYDYYTDIEIGFKISDEQSGYQISAIDLVVDAHGGMGGEDLGHIQLKHIEEDWFEANWESIEINGLFTGKEKIRLDISNLLDIRLVFPKEEKHEEAFRKSKEYGNLSAMPATVGRVLKDIFSQYSYIGPLRGEPEREYIYRDGATEIGSKGEGAAFLYLSEKNKNVEGHYFYDSLTDGFEKTDSLPLHEALNRWLRLMKIENFDAEIINRIIYLSQNAGRHDGTKVGIADVGFGISQIFPIVLEGLRMPKGGTLVLEQPEIHLHPNLQMQMADYFISLALSGKRVMAETHSDHVINRLVRRIVEDETHGLKDLIGIYFIKPSENGAVYEEVIIDESKGITNWPKDFFDQAASEQMKIMQAGLQKRKKKKSKNKDSSL